MVTPKITDATLLGNATALRAGSEALRTMFQKRTLVVRGKTPVRCAFREDVLHANGALKRVQRCVVLGPVSSLSERAAWKRFQPYLDGVNATAKLPPRMSKEEPRVSGNSNKCPPGPDTAFEEIKVHLHS